MAARSRIAVHEDQDHVLVTAKLAERRNDVGHHVQPSQAGPQWPGRNAWPDGVTARPPFDVHRSSEGNA